MTRQVAFRGRRQDGDRDGRSGVYRAQVTNPALAPGVTVHHRDELDAVQR